MRSAEYVKTYWSLGAAPCKCLFSRINQEEVDLEGPPGSHPGRSTSPPHILPVKRQNFCQPNANPSLKEWQVIPSAWRVSEGTGLSTSQCHSTPRDDPGLLQGSLTHVPALSVTSVPSSCSSHSSTPSLPGICMQWSLAFSLLSWWGLLGIRYRSSAGSDAIQPYSGLWLGLADGQGILVQGLGKARLGCRCTRCIMGNKTTVDEHPAAVWKGLRPVGFTLYLKGGI